MKNTINSLFLLLLLAIGSFLAYSNFFKGTGVNQNAVAFVEVVKGTHPELVKIEEEAESVIEYYENNNATEEYVEPVIENINTVVETVEYIEGPVTEEVASTDETVTVEETSTDNRICYEDKCVNESSIKEFDHMVESELNEISEEKTTEPVIIETKKLSVIVSDISNENIDSVIRHLEDNKNVSLAFSYGSKEAMKKAKDAGFNDLIIAITMEPFNEDIWLPASTIKVNNSIEENIKVIDDITKDAYMPIAIMNQMGSKVTSKKHIDTLKPIMDELKNKNLAFIDSKSNFHSVAGDIAKEHNVPYAENYLFLDKDISSEDKILSALNALKAKSDSEMILGMGDYSAIFIKTLDKWLDDLSRDPYYEIVPVSALMK